jgi:ribonucleoside-diphosphate reductase alpha chain
MAKEGSTISGLMDSFATAISMCLQHGVPLKLLCEKFAHTRFEPSGWTGNEQIGYAKSIMDYLFRWMQLRFLSGTQLDLFAGLHPSAGAVPVAGHITAPNNAVITHNAVILSERSESKDPESFSPASTSGSVSTSTIPEPHTMLGDAFESHAHNDRNPPAQGIAPDLQASSGLSSTPYSLIPNPSSFEDRSFVHTSEAMKGLYDMGDAPSCSTCGAIMVRNGSCYRCMECGGTSGCS